MSKAYFKQAIEAVRPMAYLDHRPYLRALYEWLKAADPSFSYARFAERLGFAPTGLVNQIVLGRRPLTAKTAKAIAEGLGLRNDDRRYFLALVDYAQAKEPGPRESAFRKLLAIKQDSLASALDQKTLAYFSEWYHPVIREMIGAPGFPVTPEALAEKVTPKLRPEQVRQSLALLEELGLIVREADGSLHPKEKSLATGRDVRGMAFVRYHQKMIELGKESVTRVPARRRSITGVTVRIDAKQAEAIREKINALQLEIMALADAADAGDAIYQINMQMFPLTTED